MLITKKCLSRRAVLRGLGATVALPFLDGMVPAATALAQTAAAPVRRFGAFYVPNGMAMGWWFPKTEGPLTELPPIAASLAPHKEQLLVAGWSRRRGGRQGRARRRPCAGRRHVSHLRTVRGH